MSVKDGINFRKSVRETNSKICLVKTYGIKTKEQWSEYKGRSSGGWVYDCVQELDGVWGVRKMQKNFDLALDLHFFH